MTTVNDSFNRADESPITTNWTNISVLSSEVKLISNGIIADRGSDTIALAYWDLDTFGQDQYAKAKITAISATPDGPAVRCSTATKDCYMLEGWTGGLAIVKYVAGVGSDLTVDHGIVCAVNDILEIRAIGTAITGLRNGIQVLSATDSIGTLTGTRIGWGGEDNDTGATKFDDFEGGDFSSPAAPAPMFVQGPSIIVTRRGFSGF